MVGSQVTQSHMQEVECWIDGHHENHDNGEIPVCGHTVESGSAKWWFSFLSLFSFFGKGQGKPPKQQGFFIATEPLKSLEKKRKTVKKTRKSSQGKKTRKSKKTRKGRTGSGGFHCG